MGDWTPEPLFNEELLAIMAHARNELSVNPNAIGPKDILRFGNEIISLREQLSEAQKPLAGVPNPEGVGELLREAREAHRIMLGLANSHIDSGDPDIGEAWERRAGGIEKALRACGIETEEGS